MPTGHYDNYEDFDEYRENVMRDHDFDLWDHVPGSQFLESNETEEAFFWFNEGWLSDNNSADDRAFARQEFFDFMGMEEESFPWEDWEQFIYG